MDGHPTQTKAAGGIRRLVDACRYSYRGILHGLRHEAAIREEIILFVILAPVSALLHVSRLEHLALIVSMLLVLLVEFVNTAIESTVDRISTEHHPLAGQAKDLGSAAVLISLVMCLLIWGVVVGPLAIRSIQSG